MQYKTESRLRNQLLNEMRLEGFEVQAIESGGIGRGIPDVYFSRKYTPQYEPCLSGWMELKNIVGELDDPVKIDFRAGQYEWLMRFRMAGTNVYLVVSCNEGIYIFRNGEIKKSYPLQEFLEYRHLSKMKDIKNML